MCSRHVCGRGDDVVVMVTAPDNCNRNRLRSSAVRTAIWSSVVLLLYVFYYYHYYYLFTWVRDGTQQIVYSNHLKLSIWFMNDLHLNEIEEHTFAGKEKSIGMTANRWRCGVWSNSVALSAYYWDVSRVKWLSMSLSSSPGALVQRNRCSIFNVAFYYISHYYHGLDMSCPAFAGTAHCRHKVMGNECVHFAMLSRITIGV